MKKYITILAVLSSAVLFHATEVPKAPDPKDAQIEQLQRDRENLQRVANELNDRANKLKTQRDQLAAGLLDLQQGMQDALARLDQVTKERDQLVQAAKAKETPKVEERNEK